MTENTTGHSEFDATDGLIKLMVGMADAAATAEASKSVVPMEHTGTETEIVLKKMLTENTGASILDSGFDNGRHWQQNKGRDFDSEPAASLKFSTYRNSDGDTKVDISVTLNVYHWLKERLEYSAELDNIFHGRFLKERDADDSKHWLELMDEFPEYLATLKEGDWIPDTGLNEEQLEKLKRKSELAEIDELSEAELKELGEINAFLKAMQPKEDNDEDEEHELRFGESSGIYGEGNPITVNTYNGENLVDQVLQYVLFTNNFGGYIALQIHGGADVRGGYTKPRIFEFGHMGEYDILDNARASIYCTGKDRLPEAERFFENMKDVLNRRILPGMEEVFRKETEETRTMLLELENSNKHHWSTDDACHWYFQGSCGAGAEPQLEKYEVVNLDDEDNEFNVEVDEDTKEQTWEPGKLCIKDGNGYCPYCGARLGVSSF
jgi:hypothetical protein